jgi:diadenosine tetraphosphatase ApaH/serine/threonine PP2A family protein phosphatase
MRYGIMADIHGNLEALEAVMEAFSGERIDSLICAGDIVGYGADPVECVARVRKTASAAIAGNHEWGVLGLTSLDYFNDFAGAAIVWTKDALDAASMDYIRSLGLVYESGAMTVVHGTPESPEDFNYILSEADAHHSMQFMKTAVCFVGHSHSPGIFSSGARKAVRSAGNDVVLVGGEKYIVNVGSVGQPRDGDPRAAYAIFDTARSTVTIKRVGYDIKKAQEKILAAGLPPGLAYRLSEGV